MLVQKQKDRSMEQDINPRTEPIHIWSINLQQRKQDYIMEERLSSINVAGKTWQLHVKKKMKLENSLTPHMKINSKRIKDLNLKLDSIKHLDKYRQNTVWHKS